MQHPDEQERLLAARRRFGDLLQQEDVLAGLPGRMFEVLPELVHDQHETARRAGGSLGEQFDTGGGSPGGGSLEQPACPPGEGAIRHAAVEQRVQDRRQERRALGLHQQRAQRHRSVQVAFPQLAGLRVSGLRGGEHVGQKQGEGGLAGSVRAGQRPGARTAGPLDLPQDLTGDPQQGRGREVVARVVRRAPIVRQMHRAVEAPADPHELGQRRRRPRFAPIHARSIS